MNELYFTFKIKQHLNRGLQQLPPATVSRLANARELALQRQRVAEKRSVLATAGSFVQHQIDSLPLKQVLLALVVALSVATYAYWSAEQNISELEEIDSALLADDLPVAAYADRGFAAWLKNSVSE